METNSAGISVEDLRIVVIDSPYEQMDNPMVQDLFGKCLQVRIEGFRLRYPYGVLPVDSTDFFATHFLVGFGALCDFTPVMAFKLFTKSRCDQFNIPFSPLALMQQCQLEAHTVVLKDILDRCKGRGEDIVYIASLAVAHDFKQDREFCNKLFEIFLALQCRYCIEHHIPEGIMGTTVRFKTRRFAEFLGYKPLQYQGAELPPVKIPFVHDDFSLFHHLQEYSEAAKALANKYEKDWKNAQIFEAVSANRDPIAA